MVACVVRSARSTPPRPPVRVPNAECMRGHLPAYMTESLPTRGEGSAPHEDDRKPHFCLNIKLRGPVRRSNHVHTNPRCSLACPAALRPSRDTKGLPAQLPKLCVCLLLHKRCSRGGRGLVEDMCSAARDDEPKPVWTSLPITCVCLVTAVPGPAVPGPITKLFACVP